jgi:hypothetical protein
MANTYFPGNVIRLSTVFTASGVAVDPDTVSAYTRAPNGATVTYAYPADITKDSTGNYHIDIAPTTAGRWVYRWEGTVSNAAAAENYFFILDSEIS